MGDYKKMKEDMFSEYSEAYRKAGVDTQKAQKLIRDNLDFLRKTFRDIVITDIGGFSAGVDANFLRTYKNPVLLFTADGVGTKLTYASYFRRYDTVGYDLVGMCANDILVSGGKPVVFLDYLAAGSLDVDAMGLVLRSIASACRMLECSLVGGETAEHPSVLKPGDFDLAGFMVGVAERNSLLPGDLREGDVIIGIPSSGIHSNGVSLIRKLFFDPVEPSREVTEEISGFLKHGILLQPTILYGVLLQELLDNRSIKALAHITGGGFFENVPRILPRDFAAVMKPWKLPEPFSTIAGRGNLDFLEMVKVFNCGYGMVAIADRDSAGEVIKFLSRQKEIYRQKYINTQKEFFPEFPEWEQDWNLPFFAAEPDVIGVIEKTDSSQKVIFQTKSD